MLCKERHADTRDNQKKVLSWTLGGPWTHTDFYRGDSYEYTQISEGRLWAWRIVFKVLEKKCFIIFLFTSLSNFINLLPFRRFWRNNWLSNTVACHAVLEVNSRLDLGRYTFCQIFRGTYQYSRTKWVSGVLVYPFRRTVTLRTTVGMIHHLVPRSAACESDALSVSPVGVARDVVCLQRHSLVTSIQENGPLSWWKNENDSKNSLWSLFLCLFLGL